MEGDIYYTNKNLAVSFASQYKMHLLCSQGYVLEDLYRYGCVKGMDV